MVTLYAVEAYFLIGVLYAMYFVFRRVNKIDSGAVHANWKFRLLLVPGSTLLWPYLILKKIPTNPSA